MPFPFTDLTAVKVRPALVVSADNNRGNDIVAVFISSKVPRKVFPGDIAITETGDLGMMGLKVPSTIRCRKIVTLDRASILGELGTIPAHLTKKVDYLLEEILGLS